MSAPLRSVADSSKKLTASAVDVKGRRVVPNEFVISLSPTDQAALAEIEAALIAELVEAVKEYCADESYHLRGTVLVTIKSDENLTSGRIDIDSVVRKRKQSRALQY